MTLIDVNYEGAAVATTSSTGFTAGSPGPGGTFTVASDAGYPVTGKFEVVLDRGLANEEKVLITSRSGTTFTVASRGYDDTTATSHTAGTVTVEHCLSATTMQALVNHQNGTEADPHNTTLLNNARHDITARHAFGAALGTPGVPTALTPDITGAAGTAAQPARADHVHNVPAATASSISGTNSEGAAATFARSDHNHDASGTNWFPGAAIDNKSVGLGQITDGIIERNSSLFADVDMRIPIIQATAPGSPVAHDLWWNLTKNTLLKRNAANTQWEVVMNMGPWQQYTPTLYNFTVGGSGLNYARYTRFGSTVLVNGFFKMNVGATTSGSLFGIGLPPNAPASNLSGTYSDEFFGHMGARATDVSSGGAYAAVGVIGQGATTLGTDRIQFIATAGATGWNNVNPFTWEGPTGDRASWFAEYETDTLVDALFT